MLPSSCTWSEESQVAMPSPYLLGGVAHRSWCSRSTPRGSSPWLKSCSVLAQCRLSFQHGIQSRTCSGKVAGIVSPSKVRRVRLGGAVMLCCESWLIAVTPILGEPRLSRDDHLLASFSTLSNWDPHPASSTSSTIPELMQATRLLVNQCLTRSTSLCKTRSLPSTPTQRDPPVAL